MFRRTDPIPSSLRESALAAALSDKDLREIERRGTVIRFDAGRHAMCQGEVGRECMIVVSGSFAVERDGRGIGILQPGMVMGEVALITMEARNATVTAMEDSTAYVFNRREFVSLLDQIPRLAHLVHANVEARNVGARNVEARSVGR